MSVPAHFQPPVTGSAHATPTRAPLPQENIYDTLAPLAGEPEVSFAIICVLKSCCILFCLRCSQSLNILYK